MNKKITINLNYDTNEYLVQFFKNEILVNWEVVEDSEEVKKLIQKFYFD